MSQQKMHEPQRGMALILALLVLLVVSAVGTGMVFMANTETSISSNFRDEQTAYFSSRAGLEEVRDRLRGVAANTLNSSLPANLPGNTSGILYVTNPAGAEVVAPWNIAASNYPDTEICQEVSCTGGVPGGTPWYATQAASASYATNPQLNWKWVRVMSKINSPFAGSTTASVDGSNSGNRVCWNGSNEVVLAAGTSCQQANPNYRPVYELTALAVTPSGSRRMTQFEVTSDNFPPPPGAMVFDGPNPTYGKPSSAAFQVNGNDAALGPNNGAGCGPASNQPALGAFDNNSGTTLTSDIQSNPDRSGSYTGTGSSPSVQNVNSALGPLTTVDGLQKLSNQVTADADAANIYTGSTSSLTNPGTPSAPVINVVNGDLSVSGGFSGTGILLVTGTLTMSGTPSYNGLILVIGKGIVQKNGGGNGTLNGSILVANMFDSSGNPIPLGANNPPGAPTINWNGGGNATFQYDTCWINAVMQAFPYRALSHRELMY